MPVRAPNPLSLNSNACPGSPSPLNSTLNPTRMMNSRPDSSIRVMAMLTLIDSPTPAVVHGRHQQDDQDADEHGGRVLGPEHTRPVAAADPGGRERGRGDPRGHHGDGDHEAEDGDVERPVDVEGGPGGPRVLGHQLQVGEGGDQGEQERDQERGPDGAADVGRDLPGEGVDAGAEDVAEDEEGQHRPGDHPVEAGLLRVLDAGDVAGSSGRRTVVRLAVHAVGHADHLLGRLPTG